MHKIPQMYFYMEVHYANKLAGSHSTDPYQSGTISPQSILDIGIGFGKYGILVRELFDLPFERYEKDQWEIRIDGVEAFPMYQNPLHDYAYNHVFYEDIANITDKLAQYDVILMIDVLEHFDKEKGKSLLKALVKKTNKAIIISTPKYPAPQEAYLGNTYEAHLSRWTNIDFLESISLWNISKLSRMRHNSS